MDFVKSRLIPKWVVLGRARSIMFDQADTKLGEEIVNYWEKNIIKIEDNSPVPFRSVVSGQKGYNTYTICISNLKYGFSSLMRQPELLCEMENLANGRVRIVYKWTGPINALSEYDSADYKLLTYLFSAIEEYIYDRGGTYVPPNMAHIKSGKVPPSTQKQAKQKAAHKSTKTSAPPKSDEWWRSFQEDEENSPPKYEAWPAPQDFLEAVQNPHLCFNDAKLKGGAAETNSMGLPKVASGSFATVYEFRSGAERWAVRCFNRRPTDAHKHYKAISRFVLSDDLTYTVNFQYLADGIKLNSNWYPILKMDWVDGEPLDIYIRNHLNERDTLKALRTNFRIMLNQFQNNGIAHGDLQHGNILVKDGAIFLVDYDGMYVPELKGEHSPEIGHRNYQHPGRGEQHFGPYLDNFSAWIIDTSLLCLIEDPLLWAKYKGGDECILFRAEDFKHPRSSRLFQELLHHRSDKIRQAAENIQSLIQLSVEEIPHLETEQEGVSIPTKMEEPTGK